MRNTITCSSLFGVMLLLILNSNTSGPASNGSGNRTGGPLSISSCNGCHSGASGTTTAAIALKEKSSGTPVSKYQPGTVYTITISATHPSLTLYGFQLSALNSANATAGSFSSMGGDKHTNTSTGITLVEQHHPIPATGGAFSTSFDWTAPPAGTGAVTFSCAVNAVNGNSLTTGDAPSAPVSVTLTEIPTAVDEELLSSKIHLYPNPASDKLYLSAAAWKEDRTIIIYNLQGIQLYTAKASPSENSTEINIGALSPGMYYLQVQTGSQKASVPFIKN